MTKKKIAFFDFDGTLTSRDSLTEFYKYLYKDTFIYNYYLRNIVSLILVRFGSMDYVHLKMRRLKFLMKKFTPNVLRTESKTFFEGFMKHHFKSEGTKKIQELRKKGFEIVIVSASIDLLLQHFTKEFNVRTITNELEKNKDRFTGKFLHKKDCNFDEKVRRIKEIYNLKDYNEILAYGDSAGDHAMFEIADKAFLNHFKE